VHRQNDGRRSLSIERRLPPENAGCFDADAGRLDEKAK